MRTGSVTSLLVSAGVRSLEQFIDIHERANTHDFHRLFTDLRRRSGHKQRDIAKALDVNLSLVSQWEAGSAIPNPINFFKIVNFLGCTPQELLWGEK